MDYNADLPRDKAIPRNGQTAARHPNPQQCESLSVIVSTARRDSRATTALIRF